jgi:hypothetical protein
MIVLTSYEKASRVVSDGRFINRVRASVVAEAVKTGQSVLSRSDLTPAFAWAVAVGLIDVYAESIVDGTEDQIYSSVESSVASITDEQIDLLVVSSWNTVLGIQSVEALSNQEELSRLSSDTQFQNRVYQIIAAKASGILAQEPVVAGQPGYDANRIKRGFAMRLQAGLYLTPEFKQNFAINVLGAIGSVNAVTDESLSEAIDELLGLFIQSRLELIQSDRTLENVIL